MEEKYLVVNAGSSSLKFRLYNVENENVIVEGVVEKIREEDSKLILKYQGQKQIINDKINDHGYAVELVLNALLNYGFLNSIDEIKGIGHRILHGGEFYSDAQLINDEVISNIESIMELGKLHLPSQLAVVKIFNEKLPNVAQVGEFDTSYHATIPESNFRYAIPENLYTEHGARKYGFHGISYEYITEQMQEKLGKQDVNLIACHLGSGASITAIKNGLSYDTSMGMTPLDGLVMGTRCGSIDPALVEYICKITGKTVEETINLLNFESGLLGICGKNDIRDIEELYNEGDKKAILAVEMFVRTIVDYIASYYIELKGKVDAIVFTAGIGENSIFIREKVISRLTALGIYINEAANNQIASYKEIQEGIISDYGSEIPVWVVPTNEELQILHKMSAILNHTNTRLTRRGK